MFKKMLIAAGGGHFKKILIANRGDNGAAGAAKPERLASEASAGDLAAGDLHV